MRRLIKISIKVLFFLLLLQVVAIVLIQIPAVQTWAAKKVTDNLSERLGTTVSLHSVNIGFFSTIMLNELLIEDQSGDTLAYADQVNMKIWMPRLIYKEVRVKAMELNGLYVHFNRRLPDRIYSFEFLKGTDSTQTHTHTHTQTQTQTPTWDFSVGNIYLENIHFRMDDTLGTNVDVKMLDGFIAINSIDIPGNLISISSIELNEPNVDVWKYALPDSLLALKEERELKRFHFINSDLVIELEDLILNTGQFRYDDRMVPLRPEGMDFRHMDLSNIDIEFEDVSIIRDTIFGFIDKISAKDVSGFQISSFTADAKVATSEIVLHDLLVRTPYSEIKDSLYFSYERFDAFKRFIGEVFMDGRFHGTRISMQDLQYISPNLEYLEHNDIFIDGRVYGYVDRIRSRDVTLGLGDKTSILGSFDFSGLPDIPNTFIDLEIKQGFSNSKDLQIIIPDLENVGLVENLGNVQFKGRFTGFTNDFVANGFVDSDIGSVDTDINLKFDQIQNITSYSGNVSVDRLDIGIIANEPKLLGTTTFALEINGAGTNADQLDVNLKGQVDELIIKDYKYNDIVVDGTFDKRLFTGYFTVEDENINMQFDGTVNLNEELPIFKFNVDVSHLLLQELNLSNRPFSLTGKVQTDFRGDAVDNTFGTIAMQDICMETEESIVSIDSLSILSSIDSSEIRSISVRSDFLDANMQGTFQLASLLRSTKALVYEYFPVDPSWEDSSKYYNDFTFAIHWHENDGIPAIFFPQLTELPEFTVNGRYGGNANPLDFKAAIPRLTYGDFSLDGIGMKVNTESGNLLSNLFVRDVFRNDSLLANSSYFDLNMHEDTLNFGLRLRGDTMINRIKINGQVLRDNDSLIMHITPSSLFLNNQEWTVKKNNKVIWSQDGLVIDGLTWQSGVQSIILQTAVVRDWTSGGIYLNNIDFGDWSQLFLRKKGVTMDGKLNGSILVEHLFKEPEFNAFLSIDSLQLDDRQIGDLIFSGDYTSDNEIFSGIGALRGLHNDLEFAINYDPYRAPDAMQGKIKVNRLYFPHIQPYIKNLISDADGYLSGDLTLSGSMSDPKVKGDVTCTDIAFRVNYLNTLYRIPNALLGFSNDEILLDDVIVFDKDSNQATANGIVTHEYFRNIGLNVMLETEKFLFVETTEVDNEDFYGTFYGKGNVVFLGPVEDLEIFVSARTLRNTRIAIPVAGSKDVGEYSFYQFIQPDKPKEEEEEKVYKTEFKALRLNLDIDVTPEALLEIILDQQQGDIIRGRGNGNMQLILDNIGEFNMYGTYNITEGDYLFSLQNIFSKKFAIANGSSLTWNGDPYRATIDIDAVYSARAAPIYLIEDIIEPDSPEELVAKERVPVNLYLKLTGQLEQPDIAFDIKVPEVATQIRTTVDSKLQIISEDANAINKQVFGVLVFNRFLPTYSIDAFSQDGSNPVVTGVSNTVSEFLSNQVSLYLSDWLSQYVNDLDLNINFRSYEYQSVDELESFDSRRELQLALTKRFFNDRISIYVGGNFDFGQTAGTDPNNPDVQTRANNVAGDFVFEYSITPDGRVKVTAFRKGVYDVFNQRNENKTGVSISYREQFDNFRELRDRIKNRRKLKKDKKQIKKGKAPMQKDESEDSPGSPDAILPQKQGTDPF